MFFDVLLNTDDSLTNDSVFKITKNIGLNIDQVKKDMNDPAIQKQLRDNFQLARSMQPVSTPIWLLVEKHRLIFDLHQAQFLNKISTPKCNWPGKKITRPSVIPKMWNTEGRRHKSSLSWISK